MNQQHDSGQLILGQSLVNSTTELLESTNMSGTSQDPINEKYEEEKHTEIVKKKKNKKHHSP